MRRVEIRYVGWCLGLGASIYRHPAGAATAGEFRTEIQLDLACWTAYIGLGRRVAARNSALPRCSPPSGEVAE
jgi:hypothetical protein